MSVRNIAFALVLAVLVTLSSAFAHAQTTSGALVGVVRDPSGAVVPDTTITATNEATGVLYTGKSNQSGEYRISNLPEGTYDLRTAVAGFSPTIIKGIAVASAVVGTQDIALSITQGTTTVEVSTQANVSIDTTTAQISTTFSTKETQDLPSATIGLGVLNLSLLTPGVASSGGLGAGTGPSISGQRPRNNNFTVDGIDNNSKSVTGPLLNVPNDAVSELVLLQNVYSAQYGHSSGGQFNTVIVAGSNHIHGRLYEYFQNRNLNAVTSSRPSRMPTPRTPLSTSSPGSTSTGTAARPADPSSRIKSLPLRELRAPDHRLGRQFNRLLLADRCGLHTTQRHELRLHDQLQRLQAVRSAGSRPAAAGSQESAPIAKPPARVPPSSLRTPPASTLPSQWAATPSALPTPSTPTSRPTHSTTPSRSTIIFRVRYLYNRRDGNDTAASFPAFFIATPGRYHLISATEVHTFTPNLSNEFRVGYTRFFSQTPVPNIQFPGLNQFPSLYFYDFSTSTTLGPDPTPLSPPFRVSTTQSTRSPGSKESTPSTSGSKDANTLRLRSSCSVSAATTSTPLSVATSTTSARTKLDNATPRLPESARPSTAISLPSTSTETTTSA